MRGFLLHTNLTVVLHILTRYTLHLLLLVHVPCSDFIMRGPLVLIVEDALLIPVRPCRVLCGLSVRGVDTREGAPERFGLRLGL